jgi:methionyl-tRNA formyltransferase
MKIAILTTDRGHPVFPHLQQWQQAMTGRGHTVSLHLDRKELGEGDMLFLVSCGQIVRQPDREKFRVVLVLHASDLPKCRGWSPHIWAIVQGVKQITLCLLEAAEPVDTGAIWLKTTFTLEGHELLPEINAKLFAAELELMTRGVEGFGSIVPQPQVGEPGPYQPKRSPEDSRLDPDKSLAEQFDTLRVVDNDRYPAFIEHRGQRYLLKIEKTEQ